MLFILLVGWLTATAAYEVPYIDNQDKTYDSRVISQEGSDDTDTLVVAIRTFDDVRGYLTNTEYFDSLKIQFVLFLEARAPPYV
jgi:hypothetical protein